MKPLLALTFLLTIGLALGISAQGAEECRPTTPDAMGPFYKPDAPVRSQVGEGYLLQGRVLSTADCRPLPEATIEFWLTGPDGRYDDAHRATVPADRQGAYRFESNFPTPYMGRPPHIHVRVSAPGHQTLVTQHYPKPGDRQAQFDLVLKPERSPSP